METIVLPRVFKLKKGSENIVIPDPNPDYTLSQVADVLSGQYPEVLNGNFQGPKHENDELVYEISTTYGTKG